MTVARTLDAPALEKYFSTALPAIGSVSSVRQFDGGQSNPTYLIKASSGQYVLRRKPPGVLLPSAHAVDREFRVIRALHDTDVPGEIYRDPDLPRMTPRQRAKIYDELNRVVAALHSIDPTAVGLGDFGRAGNYAERQIARWTPAILQGVKARSLQGNASSTDASQAGERARPMAEAGWAQVVQAHH